MARPGFQLQAVPLTVANNPVQVLYLRRVLSYLLLGMLVCVGGGVFAMSQPSLLALVAGHPFISLIALFALTFWAQSAANGPRAGLAYYVFTFAMGLLLAPVLYVVLSKAGGGQTLALAGVLTVTNSLALAAYAWVSKRNFSFLGGFLMVGLITMIVAQLLNAFWLHSPFMALAIPGVLVLLFNGFILYDLSRILHSPERLPPTVAALSLFLDVFNLFMAYLRILDRD